MKRYVLGFAFNNSGHVLLIRKQKPDWQRGKWNGVGGSVEFGESIFDAMAREFNEETGLENDEWEEIALLTCKRKTWEMYVFTSIGNDFDEAFYHVTDEGVVMPHGTLPDNMEQTGEMLYYFAIEDVANPYTLQDLRER